MKGKRVLLTGGAGFIGQPILEVLLKEGAIVYCLYNKRKPTQKHPNLRLCPINLLEEKSSVKLDLLFASIKPNYCIHCAWYTNHKDYLISEINETWLKVSKQLICSFYENGGKRFIGLGTCIEYDLTNKMECLEDNALLLGKTLYSDCKIKLYRFLQQLKKEKKIDYAWARIFFVYGPNDRKGRLIPYIFNQLEHNRIAEPRYGALKRDYIFTSDLARQVVQITKSSIQGAINTGVGKSIPIQQIFNVMGEVMDKNHLIETNLVTKKDDFPSIKANLTKYKKEIGDFEFTPLKEGLAKTVESMTRNASYYSL